MIKKRKFNITTSEIIHSKVQLLTDITGYIKFAVKQGMFICLYQSIA